MAEEQKKTLDERINELVQGSVEKGHPAEIRLKEGIKDLIQRVTFPHEFCPDCDDKLFYQADRRSYRCINCGYDSNKTTEQAVLQPDKVIRDEKNLPPAVQSALSNAGKARSEPKVIPKKIRPKVSQEEEAVVRQDPNIKGDINWS
jgi:tRNA(Ile2) C34 agmatinyltransferase TiaS